MNIIIMGEESQAICIEFRKLGHNAWSCDLQECSGGYAEWHIRGDMWDAFNAGVPNGGGWEPRKECHNGNKKCHHESAPRGSKTGTQGVKGSYSRSIIPARLCIEVLKSVKR